MQIEKIQKRAREILDTLSIEEKAGLLSQIVWETEDVSVIHRELDGFLLADGPAGIRRLKDYFDEDIYNTKKSTCYPSPSAYASSWNRELVFELGVHMGKEARQEEVDTMLAPAVNIKRSPLGGRNFEYYSEDPYVTGELATAFIKGIQREGVGACLKHFAVNNQETRRMNIDVRIDEETLHETYLSAFEKPVKEGKPKMIMAAYNQINGEYCAGNPMLLNLLCKEWDYEGVIVTDCYAAHDLAKGISNGLTLQMPGEQRERIARRVEELMEEEVLTEKQLDEAVIHNIIFALEAKDRRVQDCTYDREEHHCFARELARESMVLLKNEDQTLPLSKEEKILVLGELARIPRFQGGGSSHVNPWKLEIPAEEMKKKGRRVDILMGYRMGGDSGETEKLMQEAAEAAAGYDKIVVFAGVPELVESEGYDRGSLSLPEEQNQLIFRLLEEGKPVVVALANGSVVEMPWKEQVSAILECYLGGEAGASAAAEILFGEVNPSGKLTETFPLCLEDNPSYLYFPGDTERVVYGEGKFVGYKHYQALKKTVAFPFGHGLSYTKFEYQSIEPSLNLKNPGIRVRVRNIGEKAGKEIIQIYIRRKTSGETIVPIKLVGFEKIYLEPGEEKEAVIFPDEKAFLHYRAKIHGWERRNGVYELCAGSSVEDIRLSYIIEISEKPYCMTPDSSIGDMIRIPGMYEKLERAFEGHPISMNFLKMTMDEDPLKAISMGSLMTMQTLKRVDNTLMDEDIFQIIDLINKENASK